MADFFGDILGGLSSVGDSVDDFFDSAIGSAVARGIGGGTEGKGKSKTAWNEGFMSQPYNSFNAGQADRAPTSQNFHEVEKAWLQRMKKFSGLSDDTAVKLGAK